MEKTQKPRGLAKIQIPHYTLGEELMSSISHGVGTLLSVAALVMCVIRSAEHGDTYAIVASCLYGATSILLYLMSTLYHALKVNRAKKVFRIFDHCTIYLLIAGTYTPYALVPLREASPFLGWIVFGIIWACAILGIVFTSIDLNKFKKIGTILYVVMGWMIVFTINTLINQIGWPGVFYLLGAGVVYTIGAVLYELGKKIKYMHSVFHFLVIIASVLFFISIYGYVI